MRLWRAFKDGRSPFEILSDFLPALLIIGILYAFTVITVLAGPGHIPTGYEKKADETRQVLKWGIEGENLKIWSYELHYPKTNASQTSMLFSWYLLNTCIRPMNGSDAHPGMCRKRIAWANVDINALLGEADKVNSLLPGFNTSTGYNATTPSATHKAITAANLTLQSGSPFLLLIWSAIFAVIGWLAFWIFPRRYCFVPLTLIGGALAMSTVSAAILKTSVSNASAQVSKIDTQYAQKPIAGPVFFGLLWSIVAILAFSLVCAVVDLLIGKREDGFDEIFLKLEERWFGKGGQGEGRSRVWWTRFWKRKGKRTRTLGDGQASPQYYLAPERVDGGGGSQYSDFSSVEGLPLENMEKKI